MFSLRCLFPVPGNRWRWAWRPAITTTSPNSVASSCESFADIGDLRQGSLRAQYRKCGKPNCHCAGEGAQGHGPYWLLTWLDRDTGKSTGLTTLRSSLHTPVVGCP